MMAPAPWYDVYRSNQLYKEHRRDIFDTLDPSCWGEWYIVPSRAFSDLYSSCTIYYYLDPTKQISLLEKVYEDMKTLNVDEKTRQYTLWLLQKDLSSSEPPSISLVNMSTPTTPDLYLVEVKPEIMSCIKPYNYRTSLEKSLVTIESFCKDYKCPLLPKDIIEEYKKNLYRVELEALRNIVEERGKDV